MAARHLPISDTVWTVTIDSTFTPQPPAILAAQGDTVNFQNNSGVAITIQFAPNPPGPAVSGNIMISAGGSAGFTAPHTNASANYFIYQGATLMSGPWAVQVGSGPLYVQVTWSPATGKGQTNPSPVAIPLNGYLEVFSTDTTSYNVTWPATGDPFTPPLTQVVPGSGNNTPCKATSAISEYDFRLQEFPRIIETGGNGGGKIKVQNT